MSRGQLYIISAPSGAGKTSLVKRLTDNLTGIAVSVSYTTREPRPGEVNGVDYQFITPAEFDEKVKANEFVEYAKVFDHSYGTSEKDLNQTLDKGIDVVLEIDWQGARQIREAFPKAASIFILPPARETLESRLRGRGQDNDEIIQKRMTKAVSEMEHYDEFDYLIINDDFDEAYFQLKSVIVAERTRLKRQTHLHKTLIQDLLA